MVIPVGLRTQSPANSQNPSHAHTFRDFSSTRKSALEYRDIFDVKGEIEDHPWASEHTIQFSHPLEYDARVASCNLVQTGGNTTMARATHHTFSRPKFPPGTIRMGHYTQPAYSPLEDPATSELQSVAHSIAPYLDALIESCQKYQLHCPMDGWITTQGFVTAASKAGLRLARAEFLALERACPKDSRGRINYWHVANVVQHIVAETSQPEGAQDEGAQQGEGQEVHEGAGQA
mmetsp:Transcript_5092/g.13773  ORF Transcript_5092/g.13773 Transcript_5092/m.13773 type:complete len:233 (+) Transcript_5092:137-835(+)|eukprot:CAMPEP_0202338562 /NCGR_PEP_ID=MMETSP1126-20121109/790_1 /ASSEMBLY_ACC=CAM_ASM_000457 /TAXON_ID=3047 /ORGANISM="Dunaliella tertiolecta, Strain CCMP1320" /LENGTH=232 /DNA_ID=CAMNT_0048928969 /DNA_START=106 /DNA_END=804 /DNA_ORIENTATION=-